MIYYLLVISAVVMFSFQSFFNSKYEHEVGCSRFATFYYSLLTGIIGFAALFLINKCTMSITPFTVIVAGLSAVNSIFYTLFSLKALEFINLSLYAIFSMVGGMALPFATGIIFCNEGLTFGKILCFVLIIVALSFTVDLREKRSRKCIIYYVGIFVTNGLSGVFSIIFTNGSFAKATEADYSMIQSIVTVLVSAIILLFVCKKDKVKINFKLNKNILFSVIMCGLLSIIANYILLVALNYIPGSLQYPIITGGVMVCSTIIGAFTINKPRTRDVISVIIAFVAMLALLLPF